MNERLVCFGGSCVRVIAEDQAADDLVKYVFSAIPDSSASEPHRTFIVRSESNAEKLQARCLDLPEEISGDAGSVAIFLMERVCFHLADQSAAGLLFHGACLVKNEKAIMLPARSGSGKSTLALHLAREHGWQFLTDELTLVQPGSWLCTGFTRPIHLKPAAAGLFPDLNQEDYLLVRPQSTNSSRLVTVRAAQPASEKAYPLAGVLYPHFHTGAETVLQPLSAADAALHLTTCLINARNLPGHGFAEVTQLAKSIPSWQLEYGQFEAIHDLDLRLKLTDKRKDN